MVKIRPKIASVIEVTAFYGIALFLIWGSPYWRPPILLAAVIMIGICIGSNKFHHDSIERIGLARKNFRPCLQYALPIALPFLIPLIYFAWGKPLREGWELWFSFLGYPFWGFAQQYALLGFVGNRLEDIMGRRMFLIPLINGFLFSIVHLPNPLLTVVTFIAGFIFTHVFLVKRHLIPLALIHAIFGVLLSLAFSDIYGIMSVGPAYLSRIGRLP